MVWRCYRLILMIFFLIVGISIAQKDSQQASDKPKEIIGKDGAKMVLIPAGEFRMGTDLAEIPELVKWAKQWDPNAEASWFEDETPQHTIYVGAFYMDAHEVTNAQYRKFVQATGHKEPVGRAIENKGQFEFKPWQDRDYNKDNQPVVCVNWEDAKAYAEWAGKRLPTEAEWEYAARGGLAGKRYVWGDDWPPPKNSGNFADETVKKEFPSWTVINNYDDSCAYIAPVGSYKPNGYELYDMAGNVWEWCADWYDNKYYVSSTKSNPMGPSSGNARILRGGSWHYLYANYLHVSCRGYLDPAIGLNLIGFRCAGLKVTP